MRKRIIQRRESFPAKIKTGKAVQAGRHMPAIVALKSSRKKSLAASWTAASLRLRYFFNYPDFWRDKTTRVKVSQERGRTSLSFCTS